MASENRLVISGTRTVKAKTTRLSATTVVLVLLCLMYGITYVDRVNVSTAALVFQHDLHLTNAEVGLVFSAFAYPYVIFTSFGGWFSDRFGARLTLTISALIWGGATLVTGATSTLNTMLVARAVLGLGEAATFPIATRAMCEWFPERKRAFAQGITHSSSRLGTAITPPLVAWLIAWITWRGSFVILGVVSIAWAFVWYFYFRDDPATHPAISLRELEALPTRFGKKPAPVPWLRLSHRMLPVTFVYFCYGWTLWLYLAWIPSYFLRNYRLDLKESAIFSAGVFLAGVVGDTVGGVASDSILRKTGDRIKARRNLVVAGFVCSLVFTVMVFFARGVASVALCLSAAFFFSELTIGPMWAIPMDIAPEFSGSASGIMNIGSPLAAIVSPLIFGYLIDKTNNWNYPFFGTILVLICGSIVAFWMKPEKEFRLST